jgi:GR25 family glycosyltransferase involved in LPS biosynthesis
MTLPESFDDIMNTKSYIIALKRYRERWTYTQKKLKDVGFKSVEIFDGIDGYTYDTSSIINNLNLSGHIHEALHKSPGGLGCTLSHLLLWKSIIDDNLSYLLIFEDDVLPHPDIKTLGPIWWKDCPKDADMILLGNQMNPADKQLYDPENRVVKSPAYCLHAYIMTNSGARKIFAIIDDFKRKNIPIEMTDMLMCELMMKNMINYYCWNGKNIKDKGYPVYNNEMIKQYPLDPKLMPDIIVQRRDTGLFYQNFRLGNITIEPRMIYNVVNYK